MRLRIDDGEAGQRHFLLQAELGILLDEADRVGARHEIVGDRRIDRFDIGQIGAEVRGAERRPDFLEHLAAHGDIRPLELGDDVAAAGIIGGGRDDLLAEIVVDVLRHRRAELIGRDRSAEQIRIAVPGDGVGAGAGDDVERLLLLHVVEHRERHVARLHADHQIDLVALDELLDLLQADLRVELVVLLDDLDLAAGDGPADAVEIQIHRIEIGLGGIGDRAGERIEIAEPDRRARLRQNAGRREVRGKRCPRNAGAGHELAARNAQGRCARFRHRHPPLAAA